MRRPERSRQDTLRLGNLKRAIIETHNPILRAKKIYFEDDEDVNRIGLPSIKIQCPVQIHTDTKSVDRNKDNNSAGVKRPQHPKDNLTN